MAIASAATLAGLTRLQESREGRHGRLIDEVGQNPTRHS